MFMNKPTLKDFVTPFKPGSKFEENPRGQYSIQNGVVHFRFTAMKADAETFRCYLGGYGVDKKACYSSAKRLNGADPKTFQVLNFTYAKDATAVWCMGIRIPEADPKSFDVCDDGARMAVDSDTLIWYGYAKDRKSVWYYDFDGKPTLLKKATAASFVSVGDYIHGKDENFVFIGAAVIPKSDVATWRLLPWPYSCDAKRVFCMNDCVREADPRTFTVLTSGEAKNRAGRDTKTCFYFEMPISEKRYEQLASGELDWTVLHAQLNKKRSEA
jgi:hypothetical protein